jgi:hypothetical protein
MVKTTTLLGLFSPGSSEGSTVPALDGGNDATIRSKMLAEATAGAYSVPAAITPPTTAGGSVWVNGFGVSVPAAVATTTINLAAVAPINGFSYTGTVAGESTVSGQYWSPTFVIENLQTGASVSVSSRATSNGTAYTASTSSPIVVGALETWVIYPTKNWRATSDGHVMRWEGYKLPSSRGFYGLAGSPDAPPATNMSVLGQAVTDAMLFNASGVYARPHGHRHDHH